ncbi:DUF6259 domain-containing protein [bacterium]|nr:DUF6259 domain-containing protein [bacterium]
MNKLKAEIIHLSLVLALLTALPSLLNAQKEQIVRLENKQVRFEFQPPRMGLSALVDRSADLNHIRGGRDDYTVWELVFSHGERQQVIRSSSFDCSDWSEEPRPDGGSRLRLSWRGLSLWKEKDILDITVTVDLPPDKGCAEWRIAVDNRSDSWGLAEVHFPFFTGFLAAGEYDLAIPDYKTGSLHRRASGLLTNYFGYPSSGWPMAFLSANRGDSGVYLAAHDSAAWNKRYVIEPGEKFYFLTYAENMGQAGNGFSAPYPAVIGVYRGGWIEACKLYREWTIKQAWGSGGPLSARTDTPVSIKELGLWLVHGLFDFGPVESRTNTLAGDERLFLQAKKYFGFPIGVQWYNWHHNRFDNEYPDFLPPRPGFREVTARAVKAGVLVAPYINGLSFDYDRPEYRRRFEDLAVKDRLGTPEIVFYGDFSARMTFACVSTERWHDIVTALVDTLSGYYGSNAIYLDQIAAGKPQLCFDRSHGHPLGGGGWWCADYRKLCQEAKRVAVPRGAALTTEFFCETYIDCMDAFLTWEPPDESQIPMTPAVWGGYTLCYGSPMKLDIDDRIFMAVQARDFLWGRQVGWVGMELVTDPARRAKLEWMKKLGAYRMLSHKYLTYGEFLGMLRFDSAVDSVSGLWAPPGALTAVEIRGSAPLVQGALWKAEDGALGIVLVNCGERSAECSFGLDPADYPFDGGWSGSYDLVRINPGGRRTISENRPLPATFHETLEPGEIRLLELAPRR